MKKEIWRPVKGYEGLYEVSNYGRVRSLDRYVNSKDGRKRFCCGIILSTHINREYEYAELAKSDGRRVVANKRVHKLVAQAFPEICGEWFEGCEVHHKDFNRLNNRATNLIILPQKEHKLIHKSETTDKKIKETLTRKYGKKVVCVSPETGDIVKIYESIHSVTADGFNRVAVKKCCSKVKHYNTSGGYKWKYLE